MENEKSSEGPSRKRGRPPGSKSTCQDGVVHGKFRIKVKYSKPVVLERPPDGHFEHMGQNIAFWLHHSSIVQTEYPNNACPTGQAFKNTNFLVRQVILNDFQKFVECVNKDGKLLGVRPWTYTNANVMEPNSTQWFFVYSGKIFRVRINPETKAVVKITLAANNENEVVQGKKTEEFDMAGLKFVVIRGPNGDITGAEPIQRPPPPITVHNFRDLIS